MPSLQIPVVDGVLNVTSHKTPPIYTEDHLDERAGSRGAHQLRSDGELSLNCHPGVVDEEERAENGGKVLRMPLRMYVSTQNQSRRNIHSSCPPLKFQMLVCCLLSSLLSVERKNGGSVGGRVARLPTHTS